MMTPALLPNWIDTVRQFNPVDYAVVGVRSLVLEGYLWSDLWTALLVPAAFAVLGMTFATLSFRRGVE